jgi:hypothetical protein
MNPVQGSTTETTLDHLFAQAGLEQLPTRNHPVLSTRQSGDGPIQVGRRPLRLKVRRRFRVEETRNVRRVFHNADGAPGKRAGGARFVPTQALRSEERSSSPPVPPLALIPS